MDMIVHTSVTCSMCCPYSLLISFDVNGGSLEMFCRAGWGLDFIKEGESLSVYEGKHKGCAVFEDFIIAILALVF